MQKETKRAQLVHSCQWMPGVTHPAITKQRAEACVVDCNWKTTHRLIDNLRIAIPGDWIVTHWEEKARIEVYSDTEYRAHFGIFKGK